MSGEVRKDVISLAVPESTYNTCRVQDCALAGSYNVPGYDNCATGIVQLLPADSLQETVLNGIVLDFVVVLCGVYKIQTTGYLQPFWHTIPSGDFEVRVSVVHERSGLPVGPGDFDFTHKAEMFSPSQDLLYHDYRYWYNGLNAIFADTTHYICGLGTCVLPFKAHIKTKRRLTRDDQVTLLVWVQNLSDERLLPWGVGPGEWVWRCGVRVRGTAHLFRIV